METKQDIEKRELRKQILELRNENKEYEKKMIELLQKKQDARDNDEKKDLNDVIKSYYESKSANNQQIGSINRQILELIKNQGKITALPFFFIFRQLIYPPSLLAFFLVSMISQNWLRFISTANVSR